jgi:hypothetical protein
VDTYRGGLLSQPLGVLGERKQVASVVVSNDDVRGIPDGEGPAGEHTADVLMDLDVWGTRHKGANMHGQNV